MLTVAMGCAFFALGCIASAILHTWRSARAFDAGNADAEFQWNTQNVTDYADANGSGIDPVHSSALAVTADGLPSLNIRAEYNVADADFLTSSCVAPVWYGDEEGELRGNEQTNE